MRKIRVFSAALLGVLLCLIAGCHKGANVGVVARVNGKPIAQTDLDKAYTAQLQNNPQQQPSVEQANSLKLNILHELVLEEFVEQRAAKLGITVTTTPNQATGNLENSKASSSADALKKIQALKNRLDSGEDFGTIAMHFSENPQTASNGGDMGSIPESQLKGNPLLFAAISKLKAGQDTDIIPYPDPNDPKKIGGYLIFRLLEKAQAGQRDLSDPRVQQAIRQQLHESRSQVLKAAYFEILRDDAKVENYLADQIFKESAK